MGTVCALIQVALYFLFVEMKDGLFFLQHLEQTVVFRILSGEIWLVFLCHDRLLPWLRSQLERGMQVGIDFLSDDQFDIWGNLALDAIVGLGEPSEEVRLAG
jgi:hypothetical protein